jgi:hypothetical protein
MAGLKPVLLLLGLLASVVPAAAQEVEPDFKVAFFGDQGLTPRSLAVLDMVKAEGAGMLLLLGDFDYADDPRAFDHQLTRILGADFPVFAVIGNHDVKVWPEYQRLFRERLERVPGARCDGDFGVMSHCTYKGLFFTLSGVGIWPEGGGPADAVAAQSGHAAYIGAAMSHARARWKICAWHKNQNAMQVGLKSDETGWQVYEVCRNAGAIIATAHEHSYSRTHLIAAFKDSPEVASTDNTLELAKGRTFVFVSGLGGFSARRLYGGRIKKDADPWWAAVHTADDGATAGALFCMFSPGGRSDLAECAFKSISGAVVDRFKVISPPAE